MLNYLELLKHNSIVGNIIYKNIKRCNTFNKNDIWQVCWEENNVFDCENIKFTQKNCHVEIKNLMPSIHNGLWISEFEYDNDCLRGTYHSIKQSQNKGSLFFNINSSMDELFGRWIGRSNNGRNEVGFILIKKMQKNDENKLTNILKSYIRESLND